MTSVAGTATGPGPPRPPAEAPENARALGPERDGPVRRRTGPGTHPADTPDRRTHRGTTASGLTVGTRLVERALADQLKVSRSPVRRALRLLADDGIVGPGRMRRLHRRPHRTRTRRDVPPPGGRRQRRGRLHAHRGRPPRRPAPDRITERTPSPGATA
ncbi:GntR family transcriptional regulator [Streptomyces sp. ALI-76-A]|uniref:GntR family transcriptional regulator n=1 Tax=Streptomyces sp. ALI-76-A TaxID=3025736 RepID=UPI003364D67A